MKEFQDHFSGHASAYAENRPTYPETIAAWLSQQTPNNLRAWDCATGNGQFANLLSHYFTSVIATDASKEQIAAATPSESVEYRVAPAEVSGLDDQSISLITVAQALHWFDIDRFYNEAKRVLVENGVLAIWCYELCSVSDSIDRILLDFYEGVIGDFWPPERSLVEEKYRTIPFPFQEIDVPKFAMRLEWTADQMLAYLRTWSAVQHYQTEHNKDPVSLIESALKREWKSDPREVNWPLAMRVGRM